jgi:hypothetical protein
MIGATTYVQQYKELISLHHNTKIADGQSDAKSGYSDR